MGITIIKDHMTKRNKAFEKICLMSQKDLKQFISNFLVKLGRSTVEGDGFLYSEGKVPVLLVAHMDTVHIDLPKEIVYANGTISSSQGIGGDDRCGVYMISRLVKDVDCSVLLLEDEETGCIGANKFIKTRLATELKGKFKCLIELDRKGSTDAVFYECDNPEFTEIVTQSFWKEATGSYTDIVELSPVLETASVNLSCGYYKQHTKDEYVVLSEMEKCITEALRLIKRVNKADKYYEFIESVYYGHWDKWSGYDYSGYKKANGYYTQPEFTFDIIYYDPADNEVKTDWSVGATMEEAIGDFVMNNPDIPFSCIIEIIDDLRRSVYLADYGDDADDEEAEVVN